MITSLYTDYFQKSRIFLYPILGIRRDSSIKPIKTYTSLKDVYKHEDSKLICPYHLRDNTDYKKFEKQRLLDNTYFDEFIEIHEGVGAYVFDISDFKKDLEYYYQGQYSKFSTKLKEMIKKHFSQSDKSHEYVDSYLNPSKYFKIYAELLNCDVKILEEVGELCSAPSLEHETLSIDVEEINFK